MSVTRQSDLKFVDNRWREQRAAGMTPVEQLIYRSNLLGQDRQITNTGGGNTSAKVMEADPLTGKPTEVLWVKGSGGDLGSATREGFASLYLDKLRALPEIYAASPERGLKSVAEDRMVEYYPHCVFNLNPRASSIDTPLHAFVPWRHVDHTHPAAIIALAAAERSAQLTRDVFGHELAWVPWMRPGFELGLALQELWHENPELPGVVLARHGLLNGADSSRECYERSLELIDRGARYIADHDKGVLTFGGSRYTTLPDRLLRELLCDLLPWLRGRLSLAQRVVATVHTDDAVMEFVNSCDAQRLAALGTSCPDHFLRTKIKPVFVDWDPAEQAVDALKEKLEAELAGYRRDYEAYYNRCRRPDSPAMRDPNPTVILIPGVGLVAWGKNKAESRVTAEFYRCAIDVMRGAEAIDRYTTLPEQEAFDIEYWQLEEAKLRRMPKEEPLARRIVLIIGAGSGIGKTTAHRLAQQGAHLVCADRDLTAAQQVVGSVEHQSGFTMGRAGTGASDCGNVLSVALDVTVRAQVRRAMEQTVLAFGGLDHLVITAGVYVSSDANGEIPDESWRKSFDVNVTGPYLAASEAKPIWQAQGLDASLVITTSVNGTVAKTGSLAYDASKAAANHLVRELSIQLAPLVRVNAVAPATVVAQSAMFPRDRVIASLSKYGIPFSEDEPADALREKLAEFYAKRTLLQRSITPEDQAEAIAFLVGDTARRTTGQILVVDGGLPEAFLR